MIARSIHYSGRVQGVGFRYSVKRIAEGYEITGTIANLRDGRVHLLAQATDSDELHAFLDAIAESELAGFIREIDIAVTPPDSALVGFRIVA
jgi:acylphosphatase